MRFIKKSKYHFMSLLVGVLVGAVISFAPTALAEEVQKFVLTKVDYPIVVDGKVTDKLDKPLLNHEGTTYVPLKALGALLDVEVTWNDGKKQVEIHRKPQPVPDTPLNPPKDLSPNLDVKK